MEEIWKKIDDRYFISNFGNVKSNYANKIRILKPFKNYRGYLMVNLRSGSLNKTVLVHRLVAIAFIPNPDNLPEVNHKDEDKTNNCVDNLEWCDTKYNCNYGTRNKRKGEKCKKKIFSLDENGNITHYDSVMVASELSGISKTSISKALSDHFTKNKTAGGMFWFYEDNQLEKCIKEAGIKAKTNKRKVYSTDSNGNIEHYISESEAKRVTGIHNISRSIKNGTPAGNRLWYYED